MWRILVVSTLSVLLFAATPVLALGYDSTLNTYVSNTKLELATILTSIKNLPNPSYENGKTALVDIDTKLQQIQSNAAKNITDFEKLRDEGQQKSNQLLDEINKLYTSQQALEKQVQRNEVEFKQKQTELERIQRAAKMLGTQVDSYFLQGLDSFKTYVEKNRSDLSLSQSRLQSLKDSREKLEQDNQRLSEGIVLADKISKLSTNLKARVNDANHKSSNIIAYAEELESFSDQYILSEISELEQFITDLTNNIPLAS
ncbi:hypothetical protein HCG51_07195 [Tolypothrix sp. PCC 7910]|uniref:hypothetical protein n=1 Tax=Tolypothrix sp. PCC 7910 TaxID=2099387 RepID=UPI0014277E5B|nr:hypothetical protein [Tolypothrix sp. PCC 7910]QIR36558.1 hypothetical protein HCG51_07195 [Tolypothrix sp. PCC 7910]